MSDPADTQRLIGDIVRFGTIETVDIIAHTCRVRIGDILTGPVPWLAPRAGNTKVWSPPWAGEQVLLLCAEGDTGNGIALLGIFSDANPPPSNARVDLIAFSDGAQISYDAATHALRAILPAGGTMEIVAPGGVTITGPLSVTGDVAVTGKTTVTGDVVGGGVSLKNHKHGGVQAGGAQTGAPA